MQFASIFLLALTATTAVEACNFSLLALKRRAITDEYAVRGSSAALDRRNNVDEKKLNPLLKKCAKGQDGKLVAITKTDTKAGADYIIHGISDECVESIQTLPPSVPGGHPGNVDETLDVKARTLTLANPPTDLAQHLDEKMKEHPAGPPAGNAPAAGHASTPAPAAGHAPSAGHAVQAAA